MALACLRAASACAALAVASTVIVGPAYAAEPDYSYAKGEFLSGTVAGADLAKVIQIEPAVAENQGEQPPATRTSELNARVLDAVEVRLGKALQLLPGNGFVSLGAVNQYAQAAAGGTSRAASGAVTDSGAIALGATNDWPANATFDLRSMLGDEPVDALADLRLEVGALVATAEQAGAGSPVGGYQIADLELEVSSAVVAGLAETAYLAVGAVEDAVKGLAGPDGALATALATVSGLTRLVGSDGVEITIDARLREAVEPLLRQSLGDGAVEIDLAAGTIRFDLAALVDLNHLPVGTELLSEAVIAEILARVARLLDDLAAEVVSMVLTVLDSAVLTVAVDATVAGTGVRIDLAGSLREILDGDAEGGEAVLMVLGRPRPLVDLPALLSLVTAPIHQGLFDRDGAVEMLNHDLGGATDEAIGTVGGLVETVSGLVSLRANVQEQAAGGPFTQRALQVSTPLAQLNLANATVGPNSAGQPGGGEPPGEPGGNPGGPGSSADPGEPGGPGSSGPGAGGPAPAEPVVPASTGNLPKTGAGALWLVLAALAALAVGAALIIGRRALR